jgi:hypothetical protein
MMSTARPVVNFTNILRTCSFLRRYFCAKIVQTLNLSTKKICAKLSYEKAAHKMLVKLTREEAAGGGGC